MQLGKPLISQAQAHTARRIGFNQIHGFPGNGFFRHPHGQRFNGAAGSHALEQPADSAAQADIHAPDFELEGAIGLLTQQVNIIHANNFASGNVDNLLVQQVALQQQHAFRAGKRLPVIGRTIDLDGRADHGLDLAGRQQAVAFTGFYDEIRDAVGIFLGKNGHFTHVSGKRAAAVIDRRAQNARKCDLFPHFSP